MKSGAVSGRAQVLEGDMFLTESYVAGAASPLVREMTLGDLLRKAAEDHPALIAGVPDPALRRQ
jgi:fatty-acyl-CoA synthase